VPLLLLLCYSQIMEGLIAQIQELARETDDAGRVEIQDALRNLQYSLESPYETLLRISAQVG
jgi:demethylsterigmatocystin 6-O-methyltransferase